MRAGKRAATLLPASPLVHATALGMATATLSGGGTVVLRDDQRLDAAELWRLVAREQVAVMSIVGETFARPLVEALDRDDVRALDRSSLRAIVSSGMAFAAATKQALLDRLPGLTIVDTLGASEAMITRSTVTRDEASVPTTFAAKDNVRVLTDDGRDVVPGSGEDGVLAVAGRLPLGYHRDPDATARMFREVDGVRYATPGDRARVLADGSIELLGRGSACINTGGEKVYPEEVEQVLRRHPAVVDAAVVGVPDARWGEMVTAMIELAPGHSIDDTLREHATRAACRVQGAEAVPRHHDAAAHGRRQARLPAPAGAGGRLVNADDPVRSIPALAQWAAARYGDAEAVVDGGTRVTFRELAALARRATRAAMAQGIQPGDRVAIWAPNSWEWIVAALGALGAGAWLVPVNTRFKGDEAAYVLDRADVAALFTVRGFLDTDYVAMLRETAPHLRCLDHVVFLAGARTGEHTFDDYLATGDAIDDADADARIAALGPDDVADVIFTSGTTGRPKGVMLEHGASLRAFDVWARCFGLREGDRYLIVNPFFHCFGYKAGWMACLQQGATALPMPALDLDRLLELVTVERVSALPGPPTLFSSLLDARDGDADLSSLRVGFVGASTVPPELLRRIRDELPFESLTTGYGLTECTAMVSVTRPDAEPEHVAHWNGGYPLEGIEVAIGDDDEILVRGFNVMRGYYEDPDATALAIDADGWLHTGDIGMRDDDGALRISDRKKDIYISGGFNVSPAEVENLLLGFDAISQVAVVGLPDARLGEVGTAFVVLRPGTNTSPGEVIAWAREHIANYKVPRRVEVVDELPLNASGKVLKGELRARLSEERGP